LLALAAVTMFSVSSLMPGEPAAQTTSSNGKIVYSGFDPTLGDDGLGQEDIYTMNPDGTGVTNLTQNYSMPNWSPLGEAKDNPEWSPDGTKIVFDASALSDIGSCCSRNVYVMDADGANLQRLTNTPSSFQGEDFQATWAPDGSWLAFTSTRSEGPHDPDNPSSNASDDREIYRMNADGTNEQQLTDTPSVSSDEQPSISPDGTKIAFASSQHYSQFGDPDGDQLDIYVMNADGTGEPTRLTFDSGTKNPTPNLLSESQDPAWSPDGTRIAYESTRSGNSEIWVMNSDGTGEPVNVSQHESWDSDPAWSPDGTQITFMSRRDGQEDIWTVDAPPAPTTAATFSALDVGTDTALAASEPVNLTPGSGVAAHSPDWGTAPTGGTSACTIKGTSGADTLTGTPGADTICALGGNDTVYGAGGEDIIKGGLGDDTLKGQGGNDRVIGNAGSDGLFGGNGDDKVNSKDSVSGNDSLSGGTHVSGDTKVTDATEKSIVGFP
jgi:Tol biopolymer transport system component